MRQPGKGNAVRRLRTVGLLLVASATWCAAAALRDRVQQAARTRLEKVAVIEPNVMVPMRDGVRLATHVVRPKGEGKHPLVLLRTPYRKNLGPAFGLARLGYAFAAQDCRGRYDSEGEHYPFRDDPNDAFDTIEWLAKQPWCDGKIGMIGGSYVGYTQLAAALARPPHLRCIMPTVPPSDFDHRTMYFGGALRIELAQGWLLGQALRSQRMLRKRVPAAEMLRWRPQANFRKWCWHLPLKDPGPIAIGGDSYAACWTDMVANWEKPDRWTDWSAVQRPEQIQVPTLITAGFYDIFAQENLELLLALRQRGGADAAKAHSHLIIGPWVHGVGRAAGDVNFPKAHAALHGLRDKWLARWLKGEANGVDSWPPIYAFVMGQDKWLSTDTWPPANATPTKAYLAKGKLSTEPPTAPQQPSAFTYDPANPVPTTGGTNLMLPKGIRDHRKIAQRPDVVAFHTDPLERDTVVVGPLRAHLFVSSSAPDTDITAMLLDVRPDGYRANVQDGIVRVRYREGRGAPKLLKPGEIVEVDVNLWSTAYTFKKGHRIALLVSSSNFPRFDRNLNTADAPGTGVKPRKADNKIHHDPDHLSYVELPVLQ